MLPFSNDFNYIYMKKGKLDYEEHIRDIPGSKGKGPEIINADRLRLHNR